MNKNKITSLASTDLFVYSHVPSPNGKTAGQVTAWRNLLKLQENRKVDLFLAVNSSDLDQIPDSWPNNIGSVTIISTNKILKFISVIFHIFIYSPRFSTRLTLKAKKSLITMVDNNIYERTWIECTESAVFLDIIKKKSVTTIYAQDVLIQASLRSKTLKKYFSTGIFKDENKFLKMVDKIIVPSKKDAALIESLYSIRNVEVLSPALSNFLTSINRSNISIIPYSILFWGAMSRPENSSAIIKFIELFWDKILLQFPNAVLYIVGSNPPAQLLQYATKNIIITGFLEDPSIYFERASLGIVPLEQGAGVKVKTLEMLEAGIQVISTPIGAEGVDKNSHLTIVEFNDMFDAIVTFFQDKFQNII